MHQPALFYPFCAKPSNFIIKMHQRGVIVIVLFLLAASVYSAHYEYHLSPDAMFMYIIAATTIAFGCALLVLASMTVCAQIHRLLTYLCDSDDNEIVTTVEVVTPAQQAALHILEQLTVQMIESATLPSYNSACLRCKPVGIADPPPPYPPIPIPPPSYLTIYGRPNTHNNMTLTQEPPKYTPNYDCNV